MPQTVVYGLHPADYGRLRFTVSPLAELACSLRALRSPGSYPLQAAWHRSLREREGRHQVPWATLRALLGPAYDTPDFLNPHPEISADLTTELDHLRSRTYAELAGDLERANGAFPTELRRIPPDRLGPHLADALHAYWLLAFAPHWSTISRVLHADLQLRRRQAQQHGLIEALSGCGPGVSADPEQIRARMLSPDRPDLLRDTRARPVLFMPSLFTLSSSTPHGDSHPMVIYPAAGQHGMWQPVRPPVRLTALLGETRARYLTALSAGQTSTDLAATFGVSISATNQNLRAMTEQGLVVGRRDGRRVVYERSDLAEEILDALARTGAGR